MGRHCRPRSGQGNGGGGRQRCWKSDRRQRGDSCQLLPHTFGNASVYILFGRSTGWSCQHQRHWQKEAEPPQPRAGNKFPPGLVGPAVLLFLQGRAILFGFRCWKGCGRTNRSWFEILPLPRKAQPGRTPGTEPNPFALSLSKGRYRRLPRSEILPYTPSQTCFIRSDRRLLATFEISSPYANTPTYCGQLDRCASSSHLRLPIRVSGRTMSPESKLLNLTPAGQERLTRAGSEPGT